MRLIRILVAVIVAVASVAAAIPYVFQPVNGASIPEGHQSAAALTIFFAVLGFGAGLLFAMSLSGFKTAFKKAYYFICAGLILHGLSIMVFPILLLYTPLFWTDLPNLLGDAPYTVGTVLIFVGLILFSRLLSLRNWVQNLLITIPLALVIMFAGWLVPHGPYIFSELRFDLVKSVLWLEPVFTLYCLPLLLQLRRNASFVYTRPLKWLIVATIANVVAGTVYAVSNYVQLPIEQSAVFYDVVGVLYAITQFLFLCAGYSFSRINRVQATVKQQANTVDVITFTASLASQPAAIDPLLDSLRQFTAAHDTNNLSEQDLAELAVIYHTIETYLVTKETVRSFSRQDVHRAVQNRFSPQAYAQLFKDESI